MVKVLLGVGGLNSRIWSGIPLFEGGYYMKTSMGDSFGPRGLGLIEEGLFEGWWELRTKCWP